MLCYYETLLIEYSLVRIVQLLVLVPLTCTYPVPSTHPSMLPAAAARRGAAGEVAATLAAGDVEEIDCSSVRGPCLLGGFVILAAIGGGARLLASLSDSSS
jgi:hypothetical protein